MWQKYFQDSATLSMQSIIELNDQISFYLIVILVFISWMLFSIAWKFSNTNNKLKYKYENHGISAYYLKNNIFFSTANKKIFKYFI